MSLTKYIEETSLSHNLVKALGLEVPSKVQLWKPPRVTVQHATRITIQEQNATRSAQSQRADWLKLLARETLIDLKYVVKGQAFEVQFEGHTRVFRVVGIDTNEETNSEIAQNLAGLSLNSPNWSYIFQNAAELDWDTQIDVAEEPKPKPPPTSANVGSPYSTVGGLDKQIAAVRDLIEIPLTNPQLFHQFGLKPPKGILLYGPPGTGKTHLARAIAQETHASLLAVSGAELASAYHGETEARLRAVFADARSRSPCIIVLDEVDAMCPRREDAGGGGVEARVVATLLTELDGIDSAGGEDQPRIVVVATTNRPNAIDPALRRPGRFDRELEIGIPDAPARLAILEVLLRGTPHVLSAQELESLAARTHGYVGADLGAVLLNKYVGESERAVREIFKKARGAAPSIIFFDEIDALATARESGDGRAHDGVLTSLLNEMDGIQALVGVTVVAATNRPDVLRAFATGQTGQAGVRRAARQGRTAGHSARPDADDGGGPGLGSGFARRADEVDQTQRFARFIAATDYCSSISRSRTQTEGCSGAEIAAVCQNAALMTMRADMDASYVRREDFEAAARGTKRQITQAMVAGYEAFGR
ncbi:AAA+-type ATPase [Ceratobasidium sp. 392]|nr:AAA+-type ATPase [Ceratobasidium sp. 392]